jgi:protein TonB
LLHGGLIGSALLTGGGRAAGPSEQEVEIRLDLWNVPVAPPPPPAPPPATELAVEPLPAPAALPEVVVEPVVDEIDAPTLAEATAVTASELTEPQPDWHARIAPPRAPAVDSPPPPVTATPVVRTFAPLPGHNPPPDYPAAARRRRCEGTVVLLVEVAPDGAVAAVTVRTTSGHLLLDQAAVAAVRAWRFDGGPAAVEVPIAFVLR